MSFGPYAQDMYILNLPDNFLFSHGLIDLINLHIAMVAEVFYSCLTDIFQEQYSYFFFRITRFGWLHICKYAHKLINKQKGLILDFLFCQITQYCMKKTLYSLTVTY